MIMLFNISYNNDNVIITISRHIQNPDIIRTAIFRNIQQYSTMFTDIEEY